MIFFKILIGLLGLTVVVVIHEFGHFLAAKLCGVTVESFSIGWGPVLFRKKFKQTEFRISAIPLGGYCGMKGEKAYQEALDNKLPEIPKEEGGLYTVHPLKRILIAFAGPFFNLIFACIATMIVLTIGYSTITTESKIILATDIDNTFVSSAKEAGLLSGDKVVSINGKQINYFTELQEIVMMNPTESLDFIVLRNNQELSFKVTPILDPETAAGKIGVYQWVDPIIDSIEENSKAQLAGFMPDDKILAVNGVAIQNQMDLSKNIFENSTENEFSVLRNGKEISLSLAFYNDQQEKTPIGITWKHIELPSPKYGFFGTIVHGCTETFTRLQQTIKGLTFLFKGVDVKKAVSGPVRITFMLGDFAQQGFASSMAEGWLILLDFLSLISISLFLMNLLPIPVLDGGLILLALIELIVRKPINPRVMYYYQLVGILLVLALIIFAFFGDISYLIGH